jgi:c-di-GMP-binding flagellar brake protein YcgR
LRVREQTPEISGNPFKTKAPRPMNSMFVMVLSQNGVCLMSQHSQETRHHERRRFVRVDVYAVTRYFCTIRDKEIGVQTRISDISEGGAKLITFEEGIPVGTLVSMNFQLPTTPETFVTVEGMIRHSGLLDEDLYRSGIEFTKIPKRNLEAIRSYVASHHK